MPGSCLLASLNKLQTGVSQHHQLAWKAILFSQQLRGSKAAAH
jgi:hypothetical protein